MNKNELTKYMSLSLSMSMEESSKIVNLVLQAFEDGLCHGGEIRLRNFGTFTLERQLGEAGRSPDTGELKPTVAKIDVKFRPGTKLLDKLNSAQSPAEWKTGKAERTTIDQLRGLIK